MLSLSDLESLDDSLDWLDESRLDESLDDSLLDDSDDELL